MIDHGTDDLGADEAATLIVGAGLAGLFLALKLAPAPVVVVSAAPLGAEAASAWAQGGLAAALAQDDTPELHAADTVRAGAGLVDPVVADLIAREGPARVRDLLEIGVPFDRTPDGALRLSLEAAHSRARVARVAGDLAGRAIMDALTAAVRAAAHVRVLEGLAARAILMDEAGVARGVLTERRGGGAVTLRARDVVLATGGSGGLWAVTTNPAAATGQGLAMAALAGALIADPEFVQFHPTAIDVGRDPAPLATEALRGDGASLVNRDGRPFMARYHPDAELAPRDVVARAIHAERRAGRGAFLDCRAAIGAHFPDAFPTVYAACMAADLDPRERPIPIAPAAHYHMGGVVSDLWGKSTVPGLSVIGETASTGAHGANRLASNSLLEAVVFAARAAERIAADPTPASDAALLPARLPPTLPATALARLRAAMGDHLGVERAADDRATALAHVGEALAAHGPALPLVAAAFVAEGAARRLESRGGHFCPDHPDTDQMARRTFLTRDEVPALASVTP